MRVFKLTDTSTASLWGDVDQTHEKYRNKEQIRDQSAQLGWLSLGKSKLRLNCVWLHLFGVTTTISPYLKHKTEISHRFSHQLSPIESSWVPVSLQVTAATPSARFPIKLDIMMCALLELI